MYRTHGFTRPYWVRNLKKSLDQQPREMNYESIS